MEEFGSHITAIITSIMAVVSGYYAKIKKKFDKITKLSKIVIGDEEKKGLLKRVEALETDKSDLMNKLKKYEDLEARIDSLEKSGIESVLKLTDKMQEQIAKATTPIYKVIRDKVKDLEEMIDKKASGEILEVQVKMIMSQLEQLGRRTRE